MGKITLFYNIEKRIVGGKKIVVKPQKSEEP